MLATGCTVNRNIMFKTPVDYAFDQPPDSSSGTFLIQANDNLQFRLFANGGFKMIDLVSDDQGDAKAIQRLSFVYPVEYDGMVKLPIIGRAAIAGLTLREAELKLEDVYRVYYKQPFVQLSVTNRRVVVFNGGGGTAKVVPIENNNSTLLEVIGLSGGLDDRANAHKVKVFRKKPGGGRLVYEFDLSDIDGLKYADMVMQGDDVVYVQPNAEIAREILQDLGPVISLLTSVVLVFGIVNGLK
ncbi:MAG: polysaccharide biosynthesis/export family protein [Flavobacteriales bacterium]